MYTSYHSSIKASKFPQCLKLADITPLCKAFEKNQKERYRPGSILPDVKNLQKMSKSFKQIFKICFSKISFQIISMVSVKL